MVALRVLPLAYTGFVALGMMEWVGVAWPSMRADLGRSLAELGLLLAVWSAGYFAGAALNGRLTHRVGAGPLLAGSTSVSAAALLAIAATPSWLGLLAATLALGWGGGLLDAGVNAFVATRGRAREMGLLHAAFGIGATLGPLVMAAAIQAPGSWRTAYGALGAAHVALAAGLWRTRDRWGEVPAGRAAPPPRRPAAWLLVASLAVFFLYTGVEVAAGQWAFSLFTESRGMSNGPAGAWVAAYWGALTAGRLALGAVGDRVAPGAVVRGGLLLVLAGAALLWPAEPDWAAPLGLVVIGAGLAPVFPSLMLLTPGRLGPEFSNWAVGYQLAAASIGAAAVPGAVGVAVALAGLETLAPVLLVSGALLLAAEAALGWATRLPPSPPLRSGTPPA